jgi:hypothetical protein
VNVRSRVAEPRPTRAPAAGPVAVVAGFSDFTPDPAFTAAPDVAAPTTTTTTTISAFTAAPGVAVSAFTAAPDVAPGPAPAPARNAARPAARRPPSRRHRRQPARRPDRRWWAALGAVTLLGFGVRLATVLGRPRRAMVGDAFYYHYAANLLASGHGFIDPWRYYFGHHQAVQTANWPPLFVVVLAGAALVGFKSFFAQRVWCCVIGAAAVLVCGLAGREIGARGAPPGRHGPRARARRNLDGRRVGLVAAGLAALYPNLWMSDELLLSEALSPLMVALALWFSYRFWKRPGWRSVAALGVVMGLGALARDELALLVPLVLVPLALAVGLPWRRRLAFAGLGTLVSLAVVAPWVGYNMSRLREPTFISSGLGVTLASANCDQTYSGRFEGYWSFECSLRTPVDHRADKSVQSAQAGSYALHYVRAHLRRLPAVELARLGRAFGAFHPLWQVHLDAYVETRPYRWALVGLGSYYALVALAVGGAVVLRRRRVPVLPLLAVGAVVVATVLVSFGQTRYRTPVEVSLVLLAAVQLDRMWTGVGLASLPGTTRRRPRHAPAARGGNPPRHGPSGPSPTVPMSAATGGGSGGRPAPLRFSMRARAPAMPLHHPSRSFRFRMGRSNKA